jgi:hypothetical protein
VRGSILLALVLTAGCGARAASGPAWPKSAGAVEPDPDVPDGGESLAPRSTALAAVEKTAEPAPAPAAKPDEKPADAAPVPAPAEPAAKPEEATKPTETPVEAGPELEEIVIEIED